MSSPLEAAGAAPEPTQYAALTMDRYMSGLWTQRSPLRDADVPYIQAKFYSASRYDSLLDGLNREITAKLTLARRAGTSQFNPYTFGAIGTFYSWSYIQNNTELLRIYADTTTTIFDITGGGQTAVWTKNAAAGISRFLGVGTSLYWGDGYDTKKILQASLTWKANTQYTAGNIIIDPNGNVQQVYSVPQTATIESVEYFLDGATSGGTTPFVRLILSEPTDFNPDYFETITLSGLTTATWLNGATLEQVYPVGGQGNVIQGVLLSSGTPPTPPYGPASDTGTVTGRSIDNSGLSGGTQPTWGNTVRATTTDNQLKWVCYLSNAGKDWGLPTPTAAPTAIPYFQDELYWQANKTFSLYQAIIDTNGAVEVVFATPGPGFNTGYATPSWNTSQGGDTRDGSFIWRNCGTLGAWAANSNYIFCSAILDSNGNIQIAYDVVNPGTTGSSTPTWGTTLGATVVDNDITWLCCGPGTQLLTSAVKYGYCWHSIDGSVSTMSPLNTSVASAILGNPNRFGIQLSAPLPPDITSATPQIDQCWFFRTTQGQSTPLLLAQVPVPRSEELFEADAIFYLDMLPDTALNAEISAPVASSNNPPPTGFTAPAYHMSRIWGIVGNYVYYSGGPDTLVGNGNTAFPPLNFFQFPEAITRLIPFTTSNGGLLVCGRRNVYVILGSGTASNPFYATTYMPTVGFLGYDAMTMVGSTLYGLTTNKKFVSLDPSAGYTEVGFPIGDQLVKITTGGFNTVTFDPATAYVTWNERNSGDTAIYIASGTGFYFRFSPVASPESGYVFSPISSITQGTSAFQSIETSIGVQTILMGPQEYGVISYRDPTTNQDIDTPFSSYVTIGNIQLCESGQVAEIAHIALKSIRVGTQPTVGLLYDELATSANVQFDTLAVTCPDPPDLPESATMFSDRYVVMQNGQCPKCDNVQLKITWPNQNVPDELLKHTIYGAKFGERVQR
jgi:hypothetical protein